ncbi:hypothetical protein PCANB_001788 [Pneumocystis canis]|nr:hypothetical protein PCANB_001788 [Pneumocystis canis]
MKNTFSATKIFTSSSRYTHIYSFFGRKYTKKEEFFMMKNISDNNVLFDNYFGLKVITLNRPEKLNALTEIMIKNIYEKLKEWRKSPLTKIILLRGIDNRALCAGGDIAAVAKICRSDIENGYKIAIECLRQKYCLDYLVATFCEKPYISLMNGITMGGGAGLSIHAPFRIATENTVFAMPETDIGFFPDAGSSFFLSRMDGEIGKYIGITGERLYDRLESLIVRLSELDTDDSSNINYFNIVNRAIDEFSGEPPRDYKYTLGGETREAIDRCFKYKKIEHVLDALKKEGTEWAKSTIEKLNQRSPTSVKTALREIQEAKKWDIQQAFSNELNIASYLLRRDDFIEGVEAKLIRKPSVQPVWNPSTISDVSDKLIDTFFESNKDSPQLNISDDILSVNYHKYPYNYGLPKESDLEKSINDCIFRGIPADHIKDMVFDEFFKISPNKPGLDIKLNDILFRKQLVNLKK